MYSPGALSAFAPSASWPIVAALPSCPAVNVCCWTIHDLRHCLRCPTLPLHRHASVVRNVPPSCCESNFFLHGKLANSFPGVLSLTLPNPQPMPLSIAESSTSTAFVSLLTPTDTHLALTSTPTPRPHTSQHLLETQPSSLTPASCAIQRRNVFESPKQNP